MQNVNDCNALLDVITCPLAAELFLHKMVSAGISPNATTLMRVGRSFIVYGLRDEGEVLLKFRDGILHIN